MKIENRRRIAKFQKNFLGILDVLGWAVGVTTVMIFAVTFRIKEIAPFILPTLAGFVSISALLYNRSRAYPEGAIQRRTLIAADLSFTATIFYLISLIFGAVATYALYDPDNPPLPKKFTFHDDAIFSNLLYYWLPLLFFGLSISWLFAVLKIYAREILMPRRGRRALRSMRK